MSLIHRSIGLAIAIAFGLLCLWGLTCWIRNKNPGQWFWRLLAFGQALLGLQVLVGVILLLVIGGQHWLHYAYGAFPIVVLIFAHRSSRRLEGLEWAAFAVASLFIFGLQMRGLMTGA